MDAGGRRGRRARRVADDADDADDADPAEPAAAVSGEDEPLDPGDLPGDPKPPPRERVATRGGASFAVWSDLVEHVASPASEAPESGEFSVPADAPGLDSAESGTTAPESLPGGFDASLALGKEDVAAPLLLAARDALLDDYEAHLRAELSRAEARARAEAESAREALERRLMAHRPRYGALEERDVGARRAALRERRAAFERYLLGAARAAKLADERFASTLQARRRSRTRRSGRWLRLSAGWALPPRRRRL